MKTSMSERYELPIMIAKGNTEKYFNAKMYNANKKEIYFESSLDQQPGTDICIRMETRGHKSYRATVRWCKEILDGYTFNYRIGIQICGQLQN